MLAEVLSDLDCARVMYVCVCSGGSTGGACVCAGGKYWGAVLAGRGGYPGPML